MLIVYFFVLGWLVTLVGAVYAMRKVKNTSMWRGPVLCSNEEPPEESLPEVFSFHRLRVMGKRNVCLYYTKEAVEDRRWVVYCHGMMTHCEAEMQHLTKLNETFNVLAWDYRGFGRSTGVADETVSMYDLHYVLAWLQVHCEWVKLREDVILMGRSLGSNIVLSYVHERTVTPNRLILCHPFISLSGVFKQRGVPSTLAYFVGAMDVRGILKNFIDNDTERRVLVLGSSTDSVTCWRSAQEECEKANSWRVHLKDVGGDHFEMPPAMYMEMERFGARHHSTENKRLIAFAP